MLSIFPVKGISYYINLAQKDDYYHDDANGEPPGTILGKGALWLNLAGNINKTDFENLLNGFWKILIYQN